MRRKTIYIFRLSINFQFKQKYLLIDCIIKPQKDLHFLGCDKLYVREYLEHSCTMADV